MKGQLLVAQLPVLLQQRATQHRLGRQTAAPGLFHLLPAQIGGHQAQQLAMLVQPLRHRLRLTADLVLGESIEYAGLDDALLAHCRAPAVAGFASDSMACLRSIAENHRGHPGGKRDFPSYYKNLAFMDGH